MKKRINVLLLDNSERITYRIELMLLNNKDIENVKIAHTIVWAEDILKQTETDVIILDITFSDGNGTSFISQLRESFPKMNIIVLTNHADPCHKAFIKNLGANYFIDKSMAFQQIPNIISKISTHI